MIFKHHDANPVEMVPGLIRRVVVSDENMMLVEFTFEGGVEIPIHSHPHRQMGYLVAGRMRMTIDDHVVDCGPGDSWHAPPNIPHAGTALEHSVVVEVFHPPREDYA